MKESNTDFLIRASSENSLNKALQSCGRADPATLMSWNYRIIRHKEGRFALHEVYYHDDGRMKMYSTYPISFGSDAEAGPEELILSLEMALKDARERPIRDVTAFGED